jgi:hypothetical protein
MKPLTSLSPQNWGTPSRSAQHDSYDQDPVSSPSRYEDVVQLDLIDLDEPTLPGPIPMAETDDALRLFLVTDSVDDITVVDRETSQILAEQSSDDVTVVDADLSRRLADKSRSA